MRQPKIMIGAPGWVSAVGRHQIAYNLNGALTPCLATPSPDYHNDLIYGRILWELDQLNDAHGWPYVGNGLNSNAEGVHRGMVPTRSSTPFATMVSTDTSPT